MRIHYCDFCGAVLKDTETDLVMIIEKKKYEEEVENNPYRMPDFDKEIFEVCTSCKDMIRLIFKLKKDKMKELEKELEYVYKLDFQGEKGNNASIIRDKLNHVYLQVEIPEEKRCVYFYVESYDSKPTGQLIQISKRFPINLKEEKNGNKKSNS